MVEAQQIEHYQHQAKDGDDKAAVQGILAERRANDLALLVVEAYRQRAGLENGLQRLGFLERVVAGDGNLTAGDLRLHRGGRLDLVVQDDDDLAVVGGKIARSLGKCLGACGVEGDVHRIVLTSVGRLVHRDARDVLAGDQWGVGARGHGAVRGLAGLEGVAEVVGNGALLDVRSVGNGRLVAFIGKRIGAGEL